MSQVDDYKLEKLGTAFAYRLEKIEGGILFEIGGLERLFGRPSEIARRISRQMEELSIVGNIAVGENARSAILQARNNEGVTVYSEQGFDQMPLTGLGLDPDLLKIFEALGMRTVQDLKALPEIDLVARYGKEIRDLLDLVNNRRQYILTPNLKENFVSWFQQLDFSVKNFEQLVFIVRVGLETIFAATSSYGLRTERLEIILGLESKESKKYEIKISFPSLEIKFWLKMISLKIMSDPPADGIISLELKSHFIRPRVMQKGLFTAAKPEPESLLVTITKIKKLIGAENVGIPLILNQRAFEPFTIEPETLPKGSELEIEGLNNPGLSFSYFHPPLDSTVMISQNRLIFLRTKYFQGKVKEYSGVWIGSSEWWGETSWVTEEWDVELEGGGIFRLSRTSTGWLVTGEYD